MHSTSLRILVIGLGETGGELVDRLRSKPGVNVLGTDQLTLEEVVVIAEHDLVVFVREDDNLPRPFALMQLHGSATVRTPSALQPVEAVALCRRMHGRAPQAYEFRIASCNERAAAYLEAAIDLKLAFDVRPILRIAT